MSGESRSSLFLRHRLSVAVTRGNGPFHLSKNILIKFIMKRDVTSGVPFASV